MSCLKNLIVSITATLDLPAPERNRRPLLIGESYQAGSYELLMHFDEYFARKEAKLPTPPFLSKVPIRIRIADVSQRIHLPIQFGPWSYTYSRGS